MGTWISHLRIAENLLDALPDLDEVAFTCGNLAPDSGIPNANWTAFDPPKEVTHFLRSGEGERRIRDLDFYQGYLASLVPDDDLARYSFTLGYFFHLLCDNLWGRLIFQPSKQLYAAQFAAQGKVFVGKMKEDWYGLDQCYVRDHPDSLFWRVLMPASNPPAYLPFMSEVGLHQNLDYIRTFYSQPDPAWVLDRPYPYLNEATMTRYVTDSTRALLKIHTTLQQMPVPTNSQTALALLSQEELQPYEPPLGDG